MDSAYGTDASLRRGNRELGLDYSAAVYARTLVEGSKGRITAEALALGLPQRAWETITWREGSAEPLRSRFARVRVRARGEGCTRDEPEEWLLIEWPKGETAPTKYWLSTLPRNIAFNRLVDITMMRWRIERDY
jgi:SRSO17 transposase